MKEINIGYFKYFGNKEINKIKKKFEEENAGYLLNLHALSHDYLYHELNEKKILLALTDPRDDDLAKYQVYPVISAGIMAILQKGNFMSGQQTIELNDLSKIPDILIAKTDDEQSELHFHKDILKIKSPFIAVENVNEASLMAESGSGFFIMNELTANLLKNKDKLQQLFLLKNGKQLRQDYVLLHQKDEQQNQVLQKLVTMISSEFKKIISCEQ